MAEAAIILAAGIAYVYLGYPLLIGLWARLRPRPLNLKNQPLPRLSLIVPCHNEAPSIAGRLRNVLEQEYPDDKIEVVVVDDGSTDGTAAAVQQGEVPGLRLLELPENLGKMEAINRAWTLTSGEIVVLTDATARFEPGALRELVQPFSDPEVGAVSGELILAEEKHPEQVRVDAYWKMEKHIRRAESRVGSVIGATGAIWALRRNLFIPLSPDTILDDVLLPLEAVRRGYRLVFASSARARETLRTDPDLEFRRKVRTLAGNYQAFARAPWLFSPRYGLLLQVCSHKLGRLLIPFLLPPLFLACLLSPPPGPVAAGLQAFFYLLAAAGWLAGRRGRSPRILSIPFTFCLLNLAALKAAALYFLAPRRLRWN